VPFAKLLRAAHVTAGTDAVPAKPVPIRAMVLLAMAAFSSSVNMRVSDPLLPMIAGDLSVTVGSASTTIAAFAVGYGLLQLVFGPVGDRFGKYLVAGLCSIATGIATALAMLTTSLEGLVAVRFLSGAMAAAAIPLAFAWIGDVVDLANRQAVLARFLSAQIAGIVLGQAVGGLLGDLLGWRPVFLVVGVCHVLAGVAMLIELAAHPGVQPLVSARKSSPSDVAADTLRLLRQPWVQVMLLSVGIEGFAFYGAFAYIGADLHHRLGVDLAVVGLMMAAFGFGALSYALNARRFLQRLGERGLALGGGILLAIGYFAFAIVTTAWVVPGIMFVLGLGFYMIHNTLQSNATQMAPEARGLGVSLFALALFIGQSLGVALAAPVVDRFGAPAIYVAVAMILPAIALWFRSRLAVRPS
jgi:predicted MFS family arabinose efflux permease